MSTSRPPTPAATSDTSSDADSLSDLDSGWTDLETNRDHSNNGRHSPMTISEAGDSEDARSVIDRNDGETWEGLAPELDVPQQHIGEDTIHVDSLTTAEPSRSLRPIPEVSELNLEDWVADAVGSSLLSDDETPTPHMSIHSTSSPLRLSFPDPLSNANHDLLPSHSSTRFQSLSGEANHGARSLSPTRTESLSSFTAHSATGTTPSDTSFSVQDEDEEVLEETHHDILPVELGPPVASYALSVILLGHPPLPNLKQSTLSTLLDIVALALDGSPRVPEGHDASRIYEVCICAHHVQSVEGPDATLTHRIIIEDRTSGMSPSSSFTTLHCPTLAIVFIQPPLSTPSLPSLPWNTRYLPLLLPSISDGFSSSLLDLSPSLLFEHSVPEIPAPDNTAMKSFALQQCEEMEISGRRLDGYGEILTVEEFSRFPSHELSITLKKVLFSSKETSKETRDPELTPQNRVFSGISTFRKPIVFISAFLLALLFGSTVFLRASPSPTSQSNSSSQGHKVWSFLHPFVSRAPNTQASSSRTVSTAPEPVPNPPKSLMPSSLKSFAVSVFQPETAEPKVASTSTGRGTLSGKDKGKSKRFTGNVHAEDHHREVRPATIDPATPHLTIDAPSSKSLSLLSQAQLSSRAKGKGKEKESEIVPDAHGPFPSATTSLSTRITNALAPLFERVHTDLREIQEAIDALLQALWRLQRQTSHGLEGLAHALSEHLQTRQGVQELAGKVQRAAQSVSDKASKRHARARYNARKVRDISERYVSAARQQLKRGVDRARGNARTLKDGLVSRRLERKEARENRRAARVKRARAGCKRKSRCNGGYIFESVMALVV